MVTPSTPERKPADWAAGYPSVSPDSDWPPISASDLPADILLPRLIDVREVVPGQWSACCPAHADGRPSLSISETEDFKLLVYCHAGCDIYDVMGAVGLQVSSLYPSDYAKFKAVQAGTRKSPTAYRAKPHKAVELSVPTPVVNRMTAEAVKCHEVAVAGGHLEHLGLQLQLPVKALTDFRVGWDTFLDSFTYTFVERDGQGRIVGILYRPNGCPHKMCQFGSRRGLIYSDVTQSVALGDPSAPLYIPEGHTDTIALHGCGCLVVGRAAAKLSVAAAHWLTEYLRARPELWQSRPIVVVGDNDDAGVTGARATAEMLAVAFNKSITCAFPPQPYKDMRDWITRGGFVPGWPVHSSTKDLVQS
jgi:hypothetical protein